MAIPRIKNIALLGSTGSIGKNVLQVVRQFPGRFRIVSLAAGKNIRLLKDQIEAFQPLLVSVAGDKDAQTLRSQLPHEFHNRIVCGREGNKLVATLNEAHIVVSAIVGAAGLEPTVAAIRAGKDIALANKETLVMGGKLVMEEIARHKVSLLPVDSEHNAIFQALEAGRKEDVSKIILTASGGPFRTWSPLSLWEATPEQALNHPNWDMGRKISIDSATLMNKGLEVIEACYLFDIDVEKIEVLIHPQSIVHSLVEFIDGSVMAQLGIPDMRIPITYALSYPERLNAGLDRLNLTKCRELTFSPPDFETFPALRLAYQVCKRGGTLPAILNGANEIAVEAFLNNRIRFPEIAVVVAETVTRVKREEIIDITNILAADIAARVQAESVVEALGISTRQKKGESYEIPPLPPGIMM